MSCPTAGAMSQLRPLRCCEGLGSSRTANSLHSQEHTQTHRESQEGQLVSDW